MIWGWLPAATPFLVVFKQVARKAVIKPAQFFNTGVTKPV